MEKYFSLFVTLFFAINFCQAMQNNTYSLSMLTEKLITLSCNIKNEKLEMSANHKFILLHQAALYGASEAIKKNSQDLLTMVINTLEPIKNLDAKKFDTILQSCICSKMQKATSTDFYYDSILHHNSLSREYKNYMISLLIERNAKLKREIEPLPAKIKKARAHHYADFCSTIFTPWAGIVGPIIASYLAPETFDAINHTYGPKLTLCCAGFTITILCACNAKRTMQQKKIKNRLIRDYRTVARAYKTNGKLINFIYNAPLEPYFRKSILTQKFSFYDEDITFFFLSE